MRLDELEFPYPEALGATERRTPSRVMLVEADGPPVELATGTQALIDRLAPGDVVVINETRVLKRRVFDDAGFEVLFLSSGPGEREWDVLCPVSRWKAGDRLRLPGDVELELFQGGRPQRVRSSKPLDASYFERHGEMPLPPYILKARGERHARAGDVESYQTAWAEQDGSLAAPTASLHFSQGDLRAIANRGASVVRLTLHVGLGTFLPVTTPLLGDHPMHAEQAEIAGSAWRAVRGARGRVWALGTTVARTLESAALGLLAPADDGGFRGSTDLFIRPGFEYKVVGGLITNFHQPRSTLLALVAAFAPGGLSQVRSCYAWAIERRFRLFSYGDLSAWIR